MNQATSRPNRPEIRAKVPRRAMTLAIATQAAAAAVAKADELGVGVSVSVVDESGNLVYFARSDEASFITFETSRGKAVAAAGFRLPTEHYSKSFQSDPAFWSSISAPLKLIPAAGGYPIVIDGTLIGGIGCGGGVHGEDEACARAGAQAVHEVRTHV